MIRLLAVLFLAFSFIHPVVQAESWRDASFGAEYDAADSGDVNSGAYVDRATKGNLNSIGCQLAPAKGPCTEQSGTLENLYKKSVLGMTMRAIGFLYTTPPASTYAFVQDAAQTLGFIPRQAYAQGIGFTGLTALLPIWKAFRNMAYALLAIVMIVIGFMVMLRKKIDPKTVVTVQNALPRIVVTLLLITFSYAIVGLFIDLMYLSILLFVSILGSSGIQGVPLARLQSELTTGGFWSLWGLVFHIPNTFLADVLNPFAELFSGDIIGGILELIGDLTLINPLLYVLMGVAFGFAFIRILFMLLNAYVSILIAVVVGPLQILADALPGGNGFSSWILNLFSNVIVFPITAGLLAIGIVLGDNLSGQFWVPPLLPQWSDQLARVLIGLGITLTIPSIVNSMKEALKARAVVQAGPGAVFGPLGAGAGQALQLGYQASFVKSAFRREHAPSDLSGASTALQKPGSVITGEKH